MDSILSQIWELMDYAETMKRQTKGDEQQYWQGRADAFRVCRVLMGSEIGKDTFLDSLGIRTSQSKHLPDGDLNIAEQNRLLEMKRMYEARANAQP